MNNDKHIPDRTISELSTSQDAHAFQKEVALHRLSTIAVQQARRNVIFASDATANENAIEETRKQSASIFLQNLDRISKMEILDEVDIDSKDTERLDSTFDPLLETSKGEKFIKANQRRSTVGTRKSSIFISSNALTTLDTVTRDIQHKSLRTDDAGASVEHLSSGSTSSRKEGSENVGVQSMQVDVPPIDFFTPLEAAAISCVLQEFLEQLATFGFMIPADVDPRWDDTFKTIDETYGVPDEPKMIFREDMGLLPLVPTGDEKMQRDRNYLRKVLEKVLRDVRYGRRFDSLQEEINNIAKKQEDEHNLEVNAQIWRSQAEQLRELLESDKKANEEDRKETTSLAQESDAQVDHAIFLNSAKLSYAERWAKARLEQQDLKLKLQKTDMLNELSDYTKEYSTEQVVSTEITAYLEADIKNKEEQVVEWTKKYNEEIVQRQQEIDKLKIEVEEQKFDMEEMRALRDKRQEFIDECITEEKRLQEEARYQAKLNKAATIIQKIWRGYKARQKLKKYKDLRKQMKNRKKPKKLKRAAGKKKR